VLADVVTRGSSLNGADVFAVLLPRPAMRGGRSDQQVITPSGEYKSKGPF